MTELYLLWCAWRNKRIHLGFWMAYQCHLIATHPARNLSLCNILGAFDRRNMVIRRSPNLSPRIMVHPPGPFDISLCVRTNIVFIRKGVPRFYATGEAAIPAGRANAPQARAQAQVQEQGRPQLERVVAEMVEENKETQNQVTRLASMMEEFLKKFAGMTVASGAGPSVQPN